uniref:Uncharacterized protein n=1 Tax=Arundo donax TaxID=35708 RepID=A0A0A9AKH6_ARUDO
MSLFILNDIDNLYFSIMAETFLLFITVCAYPT